MNRGVVGACVGMLFLPSLVAAEKPEEALQKLQGTWKVELIDMAGKKFSPAQAGMESIIFKGDKLTFTVGAKEVKTFGITVDPAKTPAAMDWIHLELKDALPLPCVYSLKDGELRICFPLLPTKDADPKKLPKELLTGPQRPGNFETEGKPFGLVVAKKEKS